MKDMPSEAWSNLNETNLSCIILGKPRISPVYGQILYQPGPAEGFV